MDAAIATKFVLYYWRLTRGKAEDLIQAKVVAQADLDVPGWIKFVVMLGSPINVVDRRGCQRTWSGATVFDHTAMMLMMMMVMIMIAN